MRAFIKCLISIAVWSGISNAAIAQGLFDKIKQEAQQSVENALSGQDDDQVVPVSNASKPEPAGVAKTIASDGGYRLILPAASSICDSALSLQLSPPNTTSKSADPMNLRNMISATRVAAQFECGEEPSSIEVQLNESRVARASATYKNWSITYPPVAVDHDTICEPGKPYKMKKGSVFVYAMCPSETKPVTEASPSQPISVPAQSVGLSQLPANEWSAGIARECNLNRTRQVYWDCNCMVQSAPQHKFLAERKLAKNALTHARERLPLAEHGGQTGPKVDEYRRIIATYPQAIERDDYSTLGLQPSARNLFDAMIKADLCKNPQAVAEEEFRTCKNGSAISKKTDQQCQCYANNFANRWVNATGLMVRAANLNPLKVAAHRDCG